MADMIVIGAGPAGLMAAGQSALLGAKTLLIEKMDSPARKLRITGHSRCNLTNSAPLDEFIEHYNSGGRFLRPAFRHFFNTDLIQFFAELGVPTSEEAKGRVFPSSNDAGQVVDALTTWATRSGVRLWTGTAVQRLLVEEGRIVGIRLANGHTHPASAVILAAGGASYPGTGSTGDGFRLAEAVGHTIVPIRPAVIPLDTGGDTARQLEGLSLRDVTISLWIDGQKRAEETGDMLFTRLGLSGPAILTLSLGAVDGLRAGKPVRLKIDLFPQIDMQSLDTRLLSELDRSGKQQIKTLLKDLLPHRMIPVCCSMIAISPEKPANQISAKDRKRLLYLLKEFPLDVTGHRPLSAAYVTAGGVDLKEIDPRTMQSRLVPGLYFAGEVMDIDADTGGYNLQAAFSTGWLAGHSAAQQK